MTWWHFARLPPLTGYSLPDKIHFLKQLLRNTKMITITHNSKITKLQKSKIRKIQINRNIHRQIRFTLPLLALPSAQNLPRLSEVILEILLMSFWVYFRNNFWCLSEDILELLLLSFSVYFRSTFDVFLDIFYKQTFDVFLSLFKKYFWCLSGYISEITFDVFSGIFY